MLEDAKGVKFKEVLITALDNPLFQKKGNIFSFPLYSTFLKNIVSKVYFDLQLQRKHRKTNI